jgi:hypothetical protein
MNKMVQCQCRSYFTADNNFLLIVNREGRNAGLSTIRESGAFGLWVVRLRFLHAYKPFKINESLINSKSALK